MTPHDFIRKWQASTLKERSGAQEHFIDLCRLLDEPTPAEADPHGDFFCFERPVSKTLGGDGSADVCSQTGPHPPLTRSGSVHATAA